MITLGIDEVGRGPLAGPLVVGACILPPRYDESDEPIEDQLWQQELRDSKKISSKKRARLDQEIREKALACGVGWVSVDELNHVGMSEGLKLATRRAVAEIEDSKVAFDQIIIDGEQNFLEDTPYASLVTTLIKGDDKIKEVSAASIIAKVARDNYMIELADKYPEYGFDSHVGYGTKKHQNALKKFGPCPEHRLAVKPVARAAQKFGITIPDYVAQSHKKEHGTPAQDNTAVIGSRAEQVVVDFLIKKGHKILSRNYKTKFYEIDIVSATKEHIYFTEVKYRKDFSRGYPLEAIDSEKQRQITFAANCYMQVLAKKLNRPLDSIPSPILAAAAVGSKKFKLANWAVIVI